MGQTIEPLRFNVRGWVWLGVHAQGGVTAVEAWGSGRPVGRSMGLTVRPDVVQALGLPPEVRTGFDFFADLPDEDPSDEIELTLHARMADGTLSAAICSARVRVHRAARPESAGSTGMRTADAPGEQAGDQETATGEQPSPPDHLQVRQVGGVWGPAFYREGAVIFGQLEEAFREAGFSLRGAGRVLDFGCGCGRVLRGFERMTPRPEIWGTDLDPEAIDWNRKHLGHIGRFAGNRAMPPTHFPTGHFDAAYAVSVFTHLPEELQFAWLTELRRIVRPHGCVVVSTHGSRYWKSADASVREEMETRGFAYRTGLRTDGLPDYYMVAFHTPAYIHSRWSWFFEVVAVRERLIHGAHDAVILRRRDD